MKKKGCSPAKIAHVLFGLAIVAAVVATLVFFTGSDAIFSLAGTQWLMVAIALGVFSANMHMCKDCVSGCCGSGKCEDKNND